MKFEKNLPLSFDVTIQAMSILFKGEISSDFFQPSQKTSTLGKEQIMVRTLTISSPFILFQIEFSCILDS